MIDNFATVGKTSLSIYGYGPITSEVTISGFGVSERVISDKTGLFRFNKIYSYSFFYPELCIQAKDSQNRVTQPTCIPPLPVDRNIPFEVGPIFLSPTISLDKNNVVTGDTSVVSGFSIPNSQINVYIAKNHFLPTYQIASDNNGKYEFSFISPVSDSYKIFTLGKVGNDLTNKSTTLGLNTISPSLSNVFSLREFLLNNKISLLIILELLIIMVLGIMVLKEPRRRKRNLLTIGQKGYNIVP